LCGKAGSVSRTECCGNWICYDASNLYARNRCFRNHDRNTLCSYHHNEGHRGSWKDCKRCRKAFDTEVYIWYGTNKHNFEKLANPPSFEPTLCAKCGKRINLGHDGYSQFGDDHWCEECTSRMMEPELPPLASSTRATTAPRRRERPKPRAPRRLG